MDSKNNIDQLFREKLYSNEVAPSAMAWDQVNRKINKKKPVLMYWVAASVAMLIGISIVFWSSNKQSNIIADNQVDHPMLLNNLEIMVPERVIPSTQQNALVNQNIQGKNTQVKQLQVLKVQELIEVTFESIETHQIASLKPELKMDWPAINFGSMKNYHEPESSHVKITYIASNQPQQIDTTTTKGINKFWSVAQNLTSTTVLADLRDAKNNLFTRNQP